MGELARKALEAIKAQGGRVIDTDLIKRTLQEMGEEYKLGLLPWIRTEYRHTHWEEMFTLEDRINEIALTGDEAGLKVALAAYKAFFQEMLEAYEKSKTLPLFGGVR